MNDTTKSVVYWPSNYKWLQRLLSPVSGLAVQFSYAAVGLILPLAVLGLWQYAVSHEWIAIQLLPPPELVWQSLFDLWDSGDLTQNLAISLSRIFWSVLIGSSIGWLLGFSVALSKTARAYLYPSFEVFSQFPVVGWIPLLIIFLGIDEGLKIAAKTGSAEYGPREARKKRCWMMAFFPFDNPRYAVVMVVDNGISGGISVAPHIRDVAAGLFGLQNTGNDEYGKEQMD